MSETAKDVAKLEVMQSVLDGVQEQIRFADSKAAFVAVFHTFLFGFIISKGDEVAKSYADGCDWLCVVQIVLLAAYAITTLISIVYAIGTVIPKFGENAPECKIFFGHIVKCYKRDYNRYVQDALNATEEDWLKDIGTQIVENSNIAMDKHKRAKTGAMWAVAAVIAALLLAATVFVPAGKVKAKSDMATNGPSAAIQPG